MSVQLSLRGLTDHARGRMGARGIPLAAVEAALRYGRVAHVRGAQIHAIGRREVNGLRARGVDVERFSGVHVVCSREGTILTVYRNHDLRGLKPGRRGRGNRPRGRFAA